MQVGRRVARLRELHGESLRESASRTGVSHTTIARIEKGEVTGSFQNTLRKIADGYGVTFEYLLAGNQVRQDFAFSLSRLTPDQRSKLIFSPTRTRLRMVLNFLLNEYPDEYTLPSLSNRIRLPVALVEQFLSTSEETWTDEMAEPLVHALEAITGIPAHWFSSGDGADELAIFPPGTLSAFASCMKKAVQAGIQPAVMEMAIELLIMQRQVAAS